MAKKQLTQGTLVRVAIGAPYHQGVVGEVAFYGTGDSAGTLVLNTNIYPKLYPNTDKALVANQFKTLIAIEPKHAVLLNGTEEE